jgi:ferredoxin-type protein NapG
MSKEKPNMSRRGLLRGDWIKQIRNRGAKEIEKEQADQEPQFLLKKPEGQSRRNGGFVHRPPHAVPESEFVVGCTKCDACIEACPPHAIFRTPENEGIFAGLPILDADSQPCLMCDDMPCVPACEAGVLRLDAPLAMGVAKIDSIACLAFRGTVCTVCAEHCPVEDAITMEAGRPKINDDVCTACGVCLYVCPAPDNAIHLIPKN